MALEIRRLPRIIPLMRILLMALTSLFSIHLASAADLVRPAEVAAWLKENPNGVLMDVRTPKEYKGGHIEGTVLIDWNSSDFTDRVKASVDSKRPVLLICRSGRRSSEAAKAMGKLGFTRIADLKGGMIAWRKADLPTVTPQP